MDCRLVFAFGLLLALTSFRQVSAACEKSSDCAAGECCVSGPNGNSCELLGVEGSKCKKGAYDGSKLYKRQCPCDALFTCKNGQCALTE